MLGTMSTLYRYYFIFAESFKHLYCVQAKQGSVPTYFIHQNKYKQKVKTIFAK